MSGTSGTWAETTDAPAELREIVFRELEKFSSLLQGQEIWGVGVVTLVTLFLFVGATGKSAQIPLHVWLPDAMQGPTPVSALIHAATMVTAGVYMVSRLHFLFSAAPATLAVIAAIGVATALFSATIALTQTDIKTFEIFDFVVSRRAFKTACSFSSCVRPVSFLSIPGVQIFLRPASFLALEA